MFTCHYSPSSARSSGIASGKECRGTSLKEEHRGHYELGLVSLIPLRKTSPCGRSFPFRDYAAFGIQEVLSSSSCNSAHIFTHFS
jgi:hypothetical protein